MKVPWKLVGWIAAAALILAGVNHAASFIPLTPQWSAKRATAKIERLEGEVSSLEREATGNAEIGQAVETYHTREVIVREVTAQAINDARSAPDADTPLSPERATRLRDHDASVCLSPTVVCTTIDAAGDRPGALPPDGPSGEPYSG